MEYLWFKLLAYVLFAVLTYLLTNNRVAKYNWTLPVDRRINMIPIFVVPYLFLYPFIFIVFFLSFTLNKNIANEYLNALILAQLLGFIFWLIFPNGVRRSPIQPTRLGRIINSIYKHDKETNGFPSGHVFMSVISVYYALQADIITGFFMAIIGATIILSTVFIKQHYIIDVFGGIVFAVASIFLTGLF